MSRWTQWILSSGLVSNGTSQQKYYDYLTWIPRNCFSSKSSWKIVPELEMQSRSWFALGVPFPKMYGRIRISEMIFTTYGGTKFFSYLIHEGLSHLCNLRSESSDLCREKYKKFKHKKSLSKIANEHGGKQANKLLVKNGCNFTSRSWPAHFFSYPNCSASSYLQIVLTVDWRMY